MGFDSSIEGDAKVWTSGSKKLKVVMEWIVSLMARGNHVITLLSNLKEAVSVIYNLIVKDDDRNHRYQYSIPPPDEQEANRGTRSRHMTHWASQIDCIASSFRHIRYQDPSFLKQTSISDSW